MRPIVAQFLVSAALLVMLEVRPLMGQVIISPEPGNRLSATVNVNVVFDSNAGLYRYDYTVTNSPSSLKEIWFFAVEFTGDIINASSPLGWSFESHDDKPIVSWAATETGSLPPDFVDDGNIVPSSFQIRPGQILAGFSFFSPDPPSKVRFFAQGFTKLPQVTGDVSELPQEGEEVLDFTLDSFVGSTSGPTPSTGNAPFPGGRRPAVDGFLVFTNIKSNDTVAAPVSIAIKFSLNGESVDRSTFRATLNREDVTNVFVPGGADADLVAVFDLNSSPLKIGRNVLLTTVQGIISETNRTASDVDRIPFFVQQ